MEENRLWVLIARHLSKEISVDESEELRQLLRQYSFYEDKFNKIIGHSEPPADQLSSPIKYKAYRLPKFWRRVVAAAFIASLAGLTYYFFYQRKADEKVLAKENEVVSKAGARTKLTLPDGTLVWLNAGSRLTYSNDYNKTLREVELEGEGFFDVAKNAERPFIVHASSLNIQVVGTEFNVKSYPQDETIETTLLRGIIEISRKDDPTAPKVILKPNEKLIFNKQREDGKQVDSARAFNTSQATTTRDISVTAISRNIPDSNKVETSWVYNRLVFDGDSFQELSEKMERWYNVKISFSNEELTHYRFKGAFVNETISEALDALQLTADFNYEINNNEVRLFRK